MTVAAQIIFVIISCLVFSFSFSNYVLSRSPSFNLKPFVVVSGSMEPTITTGSIIYSQKKEAYRVGDVVAYIRNNQVISHRVVDLVHVGKEVYYSTKGDSNNFIDIDLVNYQDIFGSVNQVIPMVGYLTIFYKTPYGLLLGTIVPLALFFSYRLKFIYNN